MTAIDENIRRKSIYDKGKYPGCGKMTCKEQRINEQIIDNL
jgi:hypothetical protein